MDEGNDAEKEGKKGKKGKKTYLFYFWSALSLSAHSTYSRKTWADRQHEDNVENAKGTPTQLQPCVF